MSASYYEQNNWAVGFDGPVYEFVPPAFQPLWQANLVDPQSQAFKNLVLAAGASVTFTCRAIPTAKNGYLLQANVAASSLCLFTVQADGVDVCAKIVNAGSEALFPPYPSNTIPEGKSFTVVVKNLSQFDIQVYSTMYWDQY